MNDSRHRDCRVEDVPQQAFRSELRLTCLAGERDEVRVTSPPNYVERSVTVGRGLRDGIASAIA